MIAPPFQQMTIVWEIGPNLSHALTVGGICIALLLAFAWLVLCCAAPRKKDES